MDPTTWLLALLLALVLLAAVGWWRAAHRIGRANRRRQTVAGAGEREAEGLLDDLGFQVEDRQVTARWSYEVDGQPVEVSCRADLLVRGRGGRWVAEVKTGARAPDPTRPSTRRQLLEYRLAFPGRGLLLVDMEARVVREVRFPL